MKRLPDFIERLRPPKEKKFLHTVFDGLETLLFQPKITTKLGTHIKDGMDLKRTMVHVVIAMQLCYIHGTLNIGHQHYLALGLYPELIGWPGLGLKLLYGLLQLLPMFVVVHVVGLGIEFFFAARKGHGIEEGFLVSGALIPLIMPPDVPLWMVAMATAFAVLIAKEAFGGTGMNIWNVALTARVFIFFAYPADISGDVWVANDYNVLHQVVGLESHTLEMKGWEELPEKVSDRYADGFSGATPLALAAEGGWDAVKSATVVVDGEEVAQYSWFNMIMGFMPGSIGETNKIFVILGALFLVITGIGSWRIMLSMIMGCAFMGLVLELLQPIFPDAVFLTVPAAAHFVMGSFFFAMAFMATDPVTAASTNRGKYIYGFLIGALGLIIRVLNPAYPEGWMLAILFMNTFAPLIDYFVLQGNIKRRLARVV